MNARIFWLRKLNGKEIFLLSCCMLFVLVNCGTSSAQAPKEPKQPPKQSNPKIEEPNLFRWRIFLDSLAQEARTVSPKERRPYAVAEVASAYWEIDHDESQAMFITALDAAWKLTEQDKKYRPMLNHVLSTASKLDSTLAKTLTDRLRKKEGAEKEADDIASATALDLLETDTEKAAELAESFAPNGLEDGSAVFFIFRLAEKDLSLSNRVYAAYLNKASANENISLEGIVRLAGYAFGYSEYYSVDKRGELSGAIFPRIRRISANPAFTSAFLSLAYRRIAKTIEQRNNATAGGGEGLNYPILFSLTYLVPEVAKFSPGSIAAWQQLQEQGIVGTLPAQSQKIADYINSINQNRSKLQGYDENPDKQERDAEASLEDVEKLVGTCQRDVVRSRAVLTFAYRKNFKRALQVAGEIEDLKQGDLVKQVIFFDMAAAALKDGDWDEAQKQIKKLTSPGIKAIANAELADALIKKNEKAQGEKTIGEAAALTEKLSETKERSGLLFGLSAILLKSDPTEARDLLTKAVKSLNKQESADKWRFLIPVRIPLGCNGDETTYWGDENLPNSNILEAAALFAKENPDATSLAIDAIADKVTKIRSLAIVTKIALTNLKKQPAK